MSGFAAIVNTDGAPVDRLLLENLTTSLFIRGPDRHEARNDGPVGLGHTLLATTAEARLEQQPATLDGRRWITGCIRVDAREDLVKKLGPRLGIRLADTPDSHLVLHAYNAWGEHCLEHLLGDFAFALWDSVKNILLCARDRFGLRQLCYTLQNDTFVASNSIHSILKYPGVSKKLSEEAIADFLLFGDHRWGNRGRTAFASVRTLEPAHYLVLEKGRVRTRRYWNGPEAPELLRYRRDSDYIDHFRELLKTAVADRLRARDVVVSLSGGMDSTSIAATVRDIISSQGRDLRLHVATVLHDSVHPSQERYYVELAGRHLGLQPRYLDGGAYPFLGDWVQTSFPVELYQPRLWIDLDQCAMNRGRVMLTGDGGDELLAPATVIQSLRRAGAAGTLLSALRLKLEYGRAPALGTGLGTLLRRWRRRSNAGEPPYPYPDWLNPELERGLNLKARWTDYWRHFQQAGVVKGSSGNSRIAMAMMTPDWNTDDLFMNSAVTLVERRCPFLDPRLMEFAMALPPLPWLFDKHLLRRTMADKLPAAIVRRPKTPLGNLHDSLLAAGSPVFDKGNRPTAELSRFVSVERIGQFGAVACEGKNYINLRPFLLDLWLRNLKI